MFLVFTIDKTELIPCPTSSDFKRQSRATKYNLDSSEDIGNIYRHEIRGDNLQKNH